MIAALRQPLSRVQATVGFLTGITTIAGVLLPFLGVLWSPRVHGEVITVVQDGRSRTPVADATVEILTLEGAIVTTLTPWEEGRAHSRLKEGGYRLRVTHPKFATEVRQIHVQGGQTAEIHVALMQRPAPLRVMTVTGNVGPLRKFVRGLGL
jgi:hypothetical protein